MVCCITVGKFDKYFFAVLSGSIFCFLNRLLNQYKCKLSKNAIIHNIFISGSKFLGIIPYLMTRKLYKDTLKKERLTKNDITGEALTNEIKRINEVRWRYLFLSAFVFLLNQALFVITNPIKTNTPNLNILFASLLYLFLSRILREILYSLSCTIDKYVMERKFISVYLLLLSNGIILFIIFGIFAIFDYFFIHLYKNYNDYFREFNTIELLVALGVIITQFSLNLCILLTNKYYSPCHIFIIFVCGQLAIYVNIDFSWKMIVVIICLLLILFLSLIFNEIFEINVCGLSDNTKRNISKRAIADEEDIIEIKKDTMETELNEGLELISRDKDDLLIQNDENIENDLNINSNSNNI